MNVPVQILEHLKCSNCEDLLSCGPVRVKQDGSDICGRCSNLEDSAVRNNPYNELAEMCMFPCKYEAAGCFKKISFSCMKQHEAGCKFRTYVCPVMPSGSCEWIGAMNGILEHTQELHPEMVLEHPCEMEHDVKTSSLKTFLTTALDVLFIVYVKVCLKTYTIYHSVRKIGKIEDCNTYNYEINIRNEYGTLTKNGVVAPQGCLAMQEDTSIPVKINTLIDALNGFQNVKFVVTIKECIKCFKCKVNKDADQVEVYDKINNIFYCKDCSSPFHSCKNASKGCIWKAPNASIFHNELFCTFTKWCARCNKNIQEFNMLDHNHSENHTEYTIKHLFGKYWQMQKDNREDIAMSVKNMSYLLIHHSNNYFQLQGRSDSANVTKCVLIIRNPKTKFVLHYIMKESFNINAGQFLWLLNLQDEQLELFLNDDKFEFSVCRYYKEDTKDNP